MIICRDCGHENAEGDQFCGSCGSFLEWAGSKVEEQAAVPVVVEAEQHDPTLVERVRKAIGVDEESLDAHREAVRSQAAAELAEDQQVADRVVAEREAAAEAERRRVAEAEAARAAAAAERARQAAEAAAANAEAEADRVRAAAAEAERTRLAAEEQDRARREQQAKAAAEAAQAAAQAEIEQARRAAEQEADAARTKAAADAEAAAQAAAEARAREEQAERERREADERLNAAAAAAAAASLRAAQESDAIAAAEAARASSEAAAALARSEAEAATAAAREEAAKARAEAAEARAESARLRSEAEARAAEEQIERANAHAASRAQEEAEMAKRRADAEAAIARQQADADAAAAATRAKADADAKAREAEAEASRLRAEAAAARARAEAEKARQEAEADAAKRAREEALRRASALVAKPVASSASATATPGRAGASPGGSAPTTAKAGPATAGAGKTRGDEPTAAQPAAAAAAVIGAVQPGAQAPGAQKVRPAPKRSSAQDLNPGDLVCGQCGVGNPPTRKFCRRCGNTLADAAPAKLGFFARVKRKLSRTPKTYQAGQRRRSNTGAPKAGKGLGAKLRVFWFRLNNQFLKIGAVLAMVAVLGFGVEPIREKLHLPNVRQTVIDKIHEFSKPVYDQVNAASDSASSSAPGHGPELAIDGAVNTYWTAAPAANGGVGAKLTVQFAKPFDVGLVRLASGAQGDDTPGNGYINFPRPSELRFTLNNDTDHAKTVAVKDVPDYQSLTVKGKGVTSITVEVTGVYPAVKGQGRSVAITDIAFHQKRKYGDNYETLAAPKIVVTSAADGTPLLTDDNLNTAWTSAPADDGVGQGFTVTFPEAVDLDRIRIAPGHSKADFTISPRPKDIQLVFTCERGCDPTKQISLPDKAGFTNVSVTARGVTSIEFQVRSVHGTGGGVAFAELQFQRKRPKAS